MIKYKYPEEKIVAMHFAKRLNDCYAEKIINADEVANEDEAAYLSNFFWSINVKAINDYALGLSVPCEGSSEYWLEKIYNSWEGYMLKVGFSDLWDKASDDA